MSVPWSTSPRQFSERTFAALKMRNFRLFFIGQLISVSGTWMQAIAQGWLVLKLTGSSVDLGFAVALQFLPILLFGTYGGLIADRFDKRTILFFTQTSLAIFAALLGILTVSGRVSVTEIYLIALANGFANMFDTPARQAFVQQMVGRDLITNAVSLNSVLMNAGRMIGPSIAAAIIAVFGMATCFFANSATFIAVLVALAMMRASEFEPMRVVERERGQLRLGLQYVRRNRILRDVLLSITAVGLFAYNFMVTLPLLAHTTFHDHSGSTYGLLTAAMGLGAVAGGLTIAYRSKPSLPLLAGLVTAFGVAISLTAIAPDVAVAELALIPTGGFSIAVIATANSLLQLNSTDYMRGRVMSLYVIAFLGTTPLGSPLMGTIAGATSPRLALGLGAFVAVATGVSLLIRLRLYRRDASSESGFEAIL